MDRLKDLRRFYTTLERLTDRVRGARALSACSSRQIWPERGVYFFFEPGEHRSDSGVGARVVRVGTHALTAGSRSSLWQRLAQHRGSATGGNHRGSIFRLLVGSALQRAGHQQLVSSWALKTELRSAALCLGTDIEDLRKLERPLELAVSNYVGAMPFLWVDASDPAGPGSLRGVIERGAIALLSNWRGHPLDRPSPDWLGNHSGHERVRLSGLWNNRHVDEVYDPAFLDLLDECVARTDKAV